MSGDDAMKKAADEAPTLADLFARMGADGQAEKVMEFLQSLADERHKEDERHSYGVDVLRRLKTKLKSARVELQHGWTARLVLEPPAPPVRTPETMTRAEGLALAVEVARGGGPVLIVAASHDESRAEHRKAVAELLTEPENANWHGLTGRGGAAWFGRRGSVRFMAANQPAMCFRGLDVALVLVESSAAPYILPELRRAVSAKDGRVVLMEAS